MDEYMFKLLKWIVSLLIVVCILVGAAVFVFLNVGPMVKKGIETAGPKITQVKVGVNTVKISPFSGSGSILGLKVGNPQGYQTSHALASDEVTIEIIPSSLRQDKVIINSITILSPEITFEGGLKENNLNQIIQNIQTTLDKLPSKKDSTSEKTTRKFQINSLAITGSQVNLSNPILKGQSLTVPLPNILMSDLGTGPEGITAAEVVKRVTSEILKKTLIAVSEKLGGLGGEKALEWMDQTKKIGEGVKKLFE